MKLIEIVRKFALVNPESGMTVQNIFTTAFLQQDWLRESGN